MEEEHAAFCWSELPAEDIQLRLHQLQRAGHQAHSGFLDTHQWSDLVQHPEIRVCAAFPDAQYRVAALGDVAPRSEFYMLPREQLPASVRTPRQLRALLRSQASVHDAVGDVILADSVWLVAFDVLQPALEEFGGQRRPAWLAPEPKPARATSAASRLDAVIAAIFHVSRAEALTAIEYKFVHVNFRLPAKRTLQIKPGDQLVYRTKGRAHVRALEVAPRSGRMWIEYQLYPG